MSSFLDRNSATSSQIGTNCLHRSQDGEDKTPGSFISEFLQSLGWTFGNTVEALVRPEKAPNPDPDWKIPVVFPTCTRGSAKCYQDHQTGCGVPNRNGRIVNGNETEANEYPWMVGIHVFKGNGIRFQCGGTLINHRYVLTAAHCLEGLRASKFLLSFGDHNRTDRQGNEIQRTLSSFLIHPRFKRGSYDNDIALLKLKADLVFSKNVRPICLPLTDANYTSQIGTVVGWGRFKMGGTQPATLQDTQVPILDNAHCRKGFRYYAREITDNMFCAGYYDGRTDACMGDSGGGILLQNEENQSVIVGIISWGDGCAKEGYPGVYTRLGRFLHWISRISRECLLESPNSSPVRPDPGQFEPRWGLHPPIPIHAFSSPAFSSTAPSRPGEDPATAMTSTRQPGDSSNPTSVRRKLPSSLYGCDHYKRNCEFYTPCCQKTYRCRFCHDQREQHVLQREDVQELVCSTCATRQDVRKDCNSCGVIFGKYFCFECKLFDDEDKQQFHCDGCGICRIGGRENFFHCPTCNMCLPKHLEGNHRCIENLSRANCPICQEDIHTSREPSQIPPCNHLIHKSCFDQLVRSGHFFCPVCAHSLVDMRDMWRLYDQQIEETPLPAIYQNLYALSYCRDCLKTSKSAFHIMGIKCAHCEGYNTVREKGPLIRLVDGSFVEANLVEEVTRGMEAEELEASRLAQQADLRLEDDLVALRPRTESEVHDNSTQDWDNRPAIGAVSLNSELTPDEDNSDKS
eukprot:snap_masked-scaffold344_size201325-processed-gene-1.2 protein:Tk02538 transcript:snap_masked-scaffold344_size201325-processed-gene-1.2-mRNA-1 annotation:"hypothetical protein DAPPUDRAFT_190026"